MNKVNQLVICKDEFEDEYEFEESIKTAVMLLLQNDYVMTIKYDEKGYGIVAIDFESNNEEYGGPMPYWLLPEDKENFNSYLRSKEDDKYEQSRRVF